ncbi:MAG: alpha/beta fold hydrolase [Gemmatimonadaceae bacterium]|nr:alpha/beta fold hydrolase [Gemmatimonadaceae bacterium]
MARYWMVTNRAVGASALSESRGSGLTYWVAKAGPLDRLSSWARVTEDKFRTMLVAAADRFPEVTEDAQGEQQHVTVFIHGYNVSWKDAAKRYAQIHRDLYEGPEGLGECVLFTWPSDGKVTNYLPDRRDARASAADLAELLDAFYAWLVRKQAEAAADDAAACKAKVSVIAHSMGNYVLQKAAQQVWTRRNQPLLVSLINQLVMVAADVDNDLFSAGETTDKSDGDALANLTYRISALYSGLDQVLGVSAGLKHFGKRRLGRSGLDRMVPAPDNVWDLDCTPFFEDGTPTKSGIHSAYFEHPEVRAAMRAILRGMDRKQVARRVPKER